jgi:fructose-1,6-bisphosphatase/inositol monophosphatase family enzyme
MDTDMSNDASAWVQRLLDLGFAVRRHLRRVAGTDGLSQPVAQESGDVVYGLDRHVEAGIVNTIESWDDQAKPLLLVAEGMGENGRLLFDRRGEAARYRLLVDPIDGTRALMYDKRSAWFLAAVARDRGEQTTLAHAFASVMVELPTSKQGWADDFAAVVGEHPQGFRRPVGGGREQSLPVQPSTAATLKDGFGQVSNFFPGTKMLASELMERIALATLGQLRPGSADVFDDQYISSGGQMVELLLGHDRFCCDLRPLFYEIINRQTGQSVRGLECHPYDVAGLLVARAAGVVLTDGFGRTLDAPFDVHTGIHWCGYANPALQKAIQPVILAWLAEKGVKPT